MGMQPVGPLAASTYWRRRVLLIVIALVLLLVGLKACGGDGDDGSLASSTRTPTPSPAPTGSASTAPASAGPSASPSSSAAPASPQPVPACGDAALMVTVESDATTYKAGAAPRFTLSVTNVGSRSCRRALGPGAVELRVFSGEDRIWSSDDCSKDTGQGILELAPREAQQLMVRWPGKRSKPDCKYGNTAQPGTYRVSARVGDIVRQGSVFRLTG